MSCIAVALLTQIGRPELEQVRDNGAVGLMADRAILGYRLVIVDKRSTLFHMTLVAGLVDTVFH